MLTLRVLGTVDVSVDGHEVDLGGRGRRAVLARLAVAEGHVVPSDRLLDDLWHGSPPPRATATLQAHVSHLRRALEPGRGPRAPSSVLVRLPPGYVLRAGEGLDAARADNWAARARTEPPSEARATLRATLALWTGPSLGEFADEPWAHAEAERLDELRRVVLERLALLEMTHGGPGGAEAAVEILTPHVAEHPLREEPARVLALALDRSGRRADAVAGLSELRARLAAERGLDPSPAITALEQRLRDTARPRVATVARIAADPASDAVIGRGAELARLDRVAARVGSGLGELVVVGGAAGIGRTTLVAELARRLRARGWRTVTARCPEPDGAPPAWVWTEVADAVAAASGMDGGEIGRCDEAPDRRDDGGADEVFRLGRTLTARLRAGSAPTLVVLDDLHRADGATRRLLRTVATAAVPHVLVVATHRDDEVDDDLVATFADVAAVTGDRLELAGLAPDACAALLTRYGRAGGNRGRPASPTGERSPTPPDGDPDLARDVAARTGGNPLFVREIARLAARVGPETARRTVPPGVRDVLRRRLSGLDEPTVGVLRRAAVLGARFDLDVLVDLERRLGGDGSRDAAAVEERVLAACERALSAGLLTELGTATDTTALAFDHGLLRDVLLEEIPRLRRARVHAAARDALTSGPDDPEPADPEPADPGRAAGAAPAPRSGTVLALAAQDPASATASASASSPIP